jgi:hypothetical protein
MRKNNPDIEFTHPIRDVNYHPLPDFQFPELRNKDGHRKTYAKKHQIERSQY